MQDSFILEGKKFISAKRASEISEYSSDYIGQLCRAGKLDCRRIGRSWFVTEESIHLHKASVLHDEIYRNRIQNLRGGKKVEETTTVSGVPEAAVTPVVTESFAAPFAAPVAAPVAAEPVSTYESLVYEADNRPLIPILGAEPESETISAPVAAHISPTEAEPAHVLSIHRDHTDASRATAIANVVRADEDVSDSASDGVEPAIPSRDVETYPEIARSVILARALRGATVVMIALFMTGVAYLFFMPGGFNGGGSGQTAQATSAVSSILGALHDSYMSFVALFTHSPAVTMNVSNTPTPVPNGVSSDVPARGIAVAPSTGTTAGDAEVKQEIQDSFSDQVQVTPDSSGTAGVITPVFKDTKGKNFVYVMVPVSNATTTITR